MKKKYITLEEVLALRGTDTKIYNELLSKDTYYYQFKDGIMCLMSNNKIEEFNCKICGCSTYILEQEEFKVEKTGLYKTRDGRIAYVSYVNDSIARGIIEGDDISSGWLTTGGFSDGHPQNSDLVEYVGD